MIKFSELKAPVGVCVLWSMSAYCYIEPDAIATFSRFNAFVYLAVAMLLWRRAVVLLPLIIYTPVQSYASVSLFSSIVFISVVTRARFLSSATLTEVALFALSIIFALYVILVTLLFGSFDPHSRMLLPYAKIALIVLLHICLTRDSKAVNDLLLYTVFLAASSIVLKYLYQADYPAIIAASQIDVDSASSLSSLLYQGESSYRLLYALQEPNYTSLEMLVAVVIGASLLQRMSGRPLQGALIAALSLLVIQVIGTFSRSGTASLSIFACLYFIFVNRSIPLAIGVAFLGSFFVMTDDALLARLTTFSFDSSILDRTLLWNTALETWSSSPLLGNGLGEFRKYAGDAAHSTWLEILSDLGIVGLLLLMGLLILFIRSTALQGKANLRTFFTVVLPPFVVMLQTITYYQLDLLLFYFGALAFATKALEHQMSNPPAHRWTR